MLDLRGENHHKINLTASEGLLLGEDIIPMLWITSYYAFLSG